MTSSVKSGGNSKINQSMKSGSDNKNQLSQSYVSGSKSKSPTKQDMSKSNKYL